MSGGFNPSPRRSGAAKGSVYEILLEGLLSGMGTALADGVDEYTYAESLAEARVLTALFSAARRLAYQWDPVRMTDFLPRWERILGLTPRPGATDIERRAHVAVKFALIGVAPTIQGLGDYVEALIGDVFVELKNGSSATASAFIPGGAAIPGGPTIPDGEFTSSVAYIDVHVEPTTGMSDQEFYDIVGLLRPALDPFIPAWAEANWHRNLGHALGGFYLDDPSNLDNEAFNV